MPHRKWGIWVYNTPVLVSTSYDVFRELLLNLMFFLFKLGTCCNKNILRTDATFQNTYQFNNIMVKKWQFSHNYRFEKKLKINSAEIMILYGYYYY